MKTAKRAARGTRATSRLERRAGCTVIALEDENGERWRVACGESVVEVITSPSSAAVMDDASRRYASALKTLAKR